MQTGFFSFLFPVENGSGKPFFGAFCFVGHPQPGGANFFGERPEKIAKSGAEGGQQVAVATCFACGRAGNPPLLCTVARASLCLCGSNNTSVPLFVRRAPGGRGVFPAGGRNTRRASFFLRGGNTSVPFFVRRAPGGRGVFPAGGRNTRRASLCLCGSNNTSVPLFVRRAPGGRGVFPAGGRNTRRASFFLRGRAGGGAEQTAAQGQTGTSRFRHANGGGKRASLVHEVGPVNNAASTHVPAAAPWMATCRLSLSGRAAGNFFKRAFPFPRIRLPIFGTFAGLSAHPATEDF